MILTGKVWKYDEEIGATDLVSATHDKLGMTRQWDECAKYLLEEIDPNLAGSVQPGDILVAGPNFGNGHAHYYSAAIMGARAAGFGGLLAEGVNGLFQRAAIDFGVPVLAYPGIGAIARHGDQLEFNLRTGEARNLTTGQAKAFAPLSPIILDILNAGGSRNWALRRVGAEHAIA